MIRAGLNEGKDVYFLNNFQMEVYKLLQKLIVWSNLRQIPLGLYIIYFPLQVIAECGPSHARQGCLSCQNVQTVSVDFGRKKVNP